MVSESRHSQLFAQGKEYKVDHFQNGTKDETIFLFRLFFIYVIDPNETQMCPLQARGFNILSVLNENCKILLKLVGCFHVSSFLQWVVLDKGSWKYEIS